MAYVNGVRLAYRRCGTPTGRPLLWLHGGASNGSTWAPLADSLAGGHRSYAPDLRGHGSSDRPGDYRLALMRDDVVALLDHLGIDRVTVIGHSLGAVVAYQLAQAHPARVAGLILEEPPPPMPLRMRLPPRPDGPLDYDWAAREAVVAEINRSDPRWWAGLTRITAPTLLVAGGPTSHLPQDLMARMAARLPAGRLVTIPAGHAVHTTQPTEFAAAVRAFLASYPTPG